MKRPVDRCWKDHEAKHLTGVVRFGFMMFTCHEHFEELQQYPVEDPNWPRPQLEN